MPSELLHCKAIPRLIGFIGKGQGCTSGLLNHLPRADGDFLCGLSMFAGNAFWEFVLQSSARGLIGISVLSGFRLPSRRMVKVDGNLSRFHNHGRFLDPAAVFKRQVAFFLPLETELVDQPMETAPGDSQEPRGFSPVSSTSP